MTAPIGPQGPRAGGPSTATQIAQYGVPLAGAALDFFGAKGANNANREIAREQMRFQERMSNTAHQREVADLIKAGLNPALAYHSGGASSPSGSSTRVENALGGAVHSAADLRSNLASTALLKAQVVKTAAEANLTASQDSQLKQESLERVAMIKAQADEMAARVPKTVAEGQRVGIGYRLDQRVFDTLVEQAAADLQLTRNNASRVAADTAMIRLGLPGARAEANAASSWWGRNVSPYLSDAESVAKGIGGLVGGFGIGRLVGRFRSPSYDDWRKTQGPVPHQFRK